MNLSDSSSLSSSSEVFHLPSEVAETPQIRGSVLSYKQCCQIQALRLIAGWISSSVQPMTSE